MDVRNLCTNNVVVPFLPTTGEGGGVLHTRMRSADAEDLKTVFSGFLHGLSFLLCKFGSRKKENPVSASLRNVFF